ncbi:uncharacterized protein [Oryza sativa Japonica Group]|uniref:CAAX prenyl protease 2/Lysostaphin resistance protein A-like domain-containing protein n=2 Tax=Oryza sativa TaxID=4530 RepID=B9FNQ1_ORYSJ|nr:uncharacterized protein LOC9270759 isoform X2 [Oryza sativa Japonica Group]EEC78916.1 hypothetical protein OsI_19329 [Oryza sativa Indica Group]EEE63126.1 hypothetical protein OsJ_17934 [Oryza sativa Japonica Group]KAF2930036.1 hypothetical protein DAI22_05g101600 [Oryza sativa Japonica Group]
MAAMLAPAALPPRGLQSKAVGNAESQLLLHGKGCIVADAIIFAAKSNERRRKSQSISQGPTFISEEASSSGSGENPTTSLEVNANDVTTDEKFTVAPRNAVLQACTLTSSLLLAGGLVLREASHFASLNGWPVADPMNLSFNFETWHLELIAGLVIIISSSRYILLQTWPDFRYSSETANRQILTSLETFDYIVVACLPGISEEVLFRGALMPIFGLNWISAFVTSAIFGILHLGNGRKYSFAIWATFVGVAYGLATIASSSIIVPMASHSINNIIGGLIWRFTNNTERE